MLGRKRGKAHCKPIQRLPARLIHIDAPNPARRAGIVVVEPDGLVLVGDGDGQGGDGGEVACGAEGGVEAVDGGVDDVGGDAGGGEEGLGGGVVALGDWGWGA